jgi:hypothetical protein
MTARQREVRNAIRSAVESLESPGDFDIDELFELVKNQDEY